MDFKTADLCDAHGDEVRVCEPLFRDFGGRPSFGGPVSTVSCFEDNSLVKAALAEPGEGRVLVVDAGGSARCAVLGERLAASAAEHGWNGLLIYGCIRDSAEIARLPIGVKALGTHPRRSEKRGEGRRDVPVTFAGVTFRTGDRVWCDGDGVVVAAGPLDP